MLAGCLWNDVVAVVNQTGEPFYLRVEGQWVWEVPPNGEGVAATGLGSGHKQVEILYPDCSRANMWGVGLPATVTIRDHEVSEASESAISSGLSVSMDLELATTDSCALR
jgi:hypothetical protein